MPKPKSIPRPVRLLGRSALIAMLLCLLASAAAQMFDGTFSAMGRYGLVKLVLKQDGSSLKGVLNGNDLTFELQGEVAADDPGFAFGTVLVPEGDQFFEAYTDGQHLELYIIAPLPDGTPDPNNVSLLEFDLAGSTPTTEAAVHSPSTPSPPAPAAPNPEPPAAGGGNPLVREAEFSNPLASPDPYVGTWSDGRLQLELEAQGGGYAGWIELDGSRFPVRAGASAEGLTGSFDAAGTEYPVSIELADEALILESGGASYRLMPTSTGGATAPGVRAAIPAQPTDAIEPADDVIASGAYGELTRDGAIAFAEALRFVLAELGETQALAGVSDAQIVDALAGGFPSLDPESQQALAAARQIWEQTRQGWAYSDPGARQEFALAVLTIAYGEQAARSALGITGASNGGGSTLGMPSPDPYLQEQTNNATSCWAAAGCEGYDPIGDEFTYETPDGY
ncbi:MAG TPA: hypothetical protein VF168_00050 [Trueperaceae bacterium]